MSDQNKCKSIIVNDRLRSFIIFPICLVTLFFLIVVSVFVLFFKDLSIIPDIEKWAQFGDYFGGVLNPIVAMAAFSLLAYSIKLQTQQMSKTEIVLKQTNETQSEQAKLLHTQNKIINAEMRFQLSLNVLLSAQDSLKYANSQYSDKKVDKVKYDKAVESLETSMDEARASLVSIAKYVNHLNGEE